MSRSLRPTLEHVRVASPCRADWDTMTGNAEVRFCEHCRKHVHDLSAMTRREAELLVAKSNGRLCIRYRRSSEGRLITKDTSPPLPPLYKIAQRASRLTAGAFSAALTITTAAFSAAAQTPSNEGGSPTNSVENQQNTAQFQSGTASLAGTILELEDSAIRPAVVTLTQVNTGARRTALAIRRGAYTFQNISDGLYDLEIVASGFARKQISNVHVWQGEARQLDVTLGAAIQVTEVMGSVVAISPVQNWILHYDKRTDDEEASATDELVYEFQGAAIDGSSETVGEMLRAGKHVDAVNRYGETALMRAVRDKETTEQLLRAGASVSATSRFGVTPLMYAMLNEDAEIAELLIEHGANPNHQDVDGRTALMFAAFDERIATIRLLLEAGADANARDKDGKSVLRYALDANREEAATLLRAAGAIE